MNAQAQCAVSPLADLSGCRRLGVKGRGVIAWLESLGLRQLPLPNRLHRDEQGLLIARHAEFEFLFLAPGPAAEPALQRLRDDLEQTRPEGCYSVPVEDSLAVFGLPAAAAQDALSTLCAVDLRLPAFPVGTIVQTLSAGAAVRLWHVPGGAASEVLVLCDASLAHHHRAALHRGIRGLDEA